MSSHDHVANAVKPVSVSAEESPLTTPPRRVPLSGSGGLKDVVVVIAVEVPDRKLQ